MLVRKPDVASTARSGMNRRSGRDFGALAHIMNQRDWIKSTAIVRVPYGGKVGDAVIGRDRCVDAQAATDARAAI